MQVYRVAAIRLMWTYNELMKCKTKITYKNSLWYLNIKYESLKYSSLANKLRINLKIYMQSKYYIH